MSTFVKGVSDEFGPMQLYKPDYSFLTQVYGTKQAEYDRGYNYVKSLYSSALNGDLTSEDNEKYRQDVFKKIKNTLKDASGLDLSNAANIGYAQSAVDPIVKDKEFVYDMSVTARHSSEMQKLENVKNSLDPKISGQYNNYSRMAIQYATDDLRHSKRGDGSIFKVTPQEFIPYQDVVEDLNKAAKEQNLNIEITQATGTGYFYKQSNGKLAYEPYTKWAMQQIGNKYDRQFQQQGYVEGESMIRSSMKEEGLSRGEAIQRIAPIVSKQLMNDAILSGAYSDEKIKEYNLRMQQYENKYKSVGFTKSAAAEYLKLKQDRQSYIDDLGEANSEKQKLSENGDEYVTSNLYNILTNQAKKRSALGWAVAHADATNKIDMTSDATYMGEFHEASQNARHSQDIKLGYENLKFKYANLQSTKEQWASQNKLNLLKLQYGDGNLPSETTVGSFQSDKAIPAVKLMQEDLHKSENNIYTYAFGNGGLIELLYDKSKGDKGVMSPLISKIQGIANGQNVKLTSQELKAFTDFGNRLGVTVYNPKNKQDAAYALRTLAGDVYTKSLEIISDTKKSRQSGLVGDKLQVYNKMVNEFKIYTDNLNNLDKTNENISKVITDGNGNIKEQYKGAKIIGYTKNSVVPIYDLNDLSESAKASIDTLIGSKYNSRTRAAGVVINAKNIQPEELYQFTNYNINANTDITTFLKSLNIDLKSLNIENFNALFGKDANIAYDPGNETITMKLNVNAAKKLKIPTLGTYELTIPYSRVKNNPTILSRLGKYIGDNTAKASDTSMLDPLITNPVAKVTAPQHLKNFGFDYSAYGTFDTQGNYGISIVGQFKDPKTKTKVPFDYFMPGTLGDDQLVHKAESIINGWTLEYVKALKNHDDLEVNDKDRIPFEQIVK